MFIIIPSARVRARAWGSAVREVTCVHCAAAYVYEVRRHVVNEETATAFVGIGNAKFRADAGATAALQRALAREEDMVPCPGCQRLQPGMNQALKNLWVQWIVMTWVAVCIVCFMKYEATEGFRPVPGWVIGVPVAATAGLVVGVVMVMMGEFRGAATDRGQLKSEAEAEGYARLAMPRVVGGGWVWVRPTVFESPPVCAGCGAEGELRVLTRALGDLRPEAKVCANCFGKARWLQRAILAMIVMVIMGGAMLVPVMTIPVWDSIDVFLAGLVGAILTGIVLAVVRNWFVGRVGYPIRFRKYRARRDEVELRFKSEAAAEEYVAAAVRRMEGMMAGARRGGG